MAACVPTLRPLFNRTIRHPWSGKTWMRTLSGVKTPCEDTDRLHNHALNLRDLSMPQVSRGLYESTGRNLVEIEGGWEYAGADRAYMESTRGHLSRGEGMGITKMTEITLEVSNK